MIENKTQESPLVKEIYENVFKKTWDRDIKKLSKGLHKKMVDDIKSWRVGGGFDDVDTHSWRSVATVFVEKYPEFAEKHNIVAGNQVSGMQLCEAAMFRLNETIENAW